MDKNKYLVLLPGIILAFVLYTLSQGFNNIIGTELLGYEKSPICTAMIAILLGMFFGNVFSIRESFVRGLDFTQKNILNEAKKKISEDINNKKNYLKTKLTPR